MAEHNTVDTGLGRVVERWAQRDPSRRALTYEGATLTYGELDERINRLATALAAGGVGRGARVAFLGLNHPAFIETMLAAARLGAVFVPLNFRLTGTELTFIINDAGVHTLVADDTHREVIDSVRNELVVERYIGSESGSSDWQSFESLVDESEPLREQASVGEDDVAIIMYTSGTTGLPKGAMLSHGNIFHHNNALLTFALWSSDEISLVVAPLFHIAGLNVNTIVTWQMGGEVVLHRAFEPAAAVAAIAEHKITNMFGVPAMFLFMSQEPDFDTADFSSLTLAIVGGAPVPEPLIERYLDKGVQFCQGYGLTETSPAAAFLLPAYTQRKVGSAGFAPLCSELAVCDEDGNAVVQGERGEICIRGPQVMLGYWNRPDATAEAIDARGWFHSGDVGYFDDEGFLYVVDRVKDMVISGGENVYPAEVEGVLYDHPKVKEVAIIGLPDERWGEAVTAVVAVVDGEALTLDELREFAEGKLAHYKQPLRLHTVDALPRNPAGKVLKFELREQFADTQT